MFERTGLGVAEPGGIEHAHDAFSSQELRAAVRPADPATTRRAVTDAGFSVRWMLIEVRPGRGEKEQGATLAREVATPPAGTRVLSVLNSNGARHANGVRRLVIEVITPNGAAGLTEPFVAPQGDLAAPSVVPRPSGRPAWPGRLPRPSGGARRVPRPPSQPAPPRLA